MVDVKNMQLELVRNCHYVLRDVRLVVQSVMKIDKMTHTKIYTALTKKLLYAVKNTTHRSFLENILYVSINVYNSASIAEREKDINKKGIGSKHNGFNPTYRKGNEWIYESDQYSKNTKKYK